jgi:hypothetical protein
VADKISYIFGRYWMDFLQEVIFEDKEMQTVIVALEPDPRKYVWREVEGRWYLYDRYNSFSLSEDDYFELAKRVIGEPVYHELRRENDAAEYRKKSRRLLIVKMQKTME